MKKIKEFFGKLYIKLFLKKHVFPCGILIHRKKANIIYETEFNWYDDMFLPVTIVREVKSGKTFSISYYDMFDFKEYSGSDPNAGTQL